MISKIANILYANIHISTYVYGKIMKSLIVSVKYGRLKLRMKMVNSIKVKIGGFFCTKSEVNNQILIKYSF